ncbi:UNVERIFIED_ORG: hypothetical protein LHK14_17755 [Roseateles sp. XES5]|nr:hypothetical protein [Roseateles sp. XES5]
MTALAFDFLTSQSPSQVHAKSMPAFRAKVPETLANRLEKRSSNDNFSASSQDDAGKGVSGVPSLQAMMRELGELISSGQPAKVLYPLLATDLRRHCPNMSLRRVRSLYNGEVCRVWEDEALALRLALAARQNQKARREFARAATEMSAKLAAAGVPLTSAQHSIVASMAEESMQ